MCISISNWRMKVNRNLMKCQASNRMRLSRIKKGHENICRDDEGLSITEEEVAKLMDENMGSAMQYLQTKGLCLIPLSIAMTISGRSTMQPNALVRSPSPCASNHQFNTSGQREQKQEQGGNNMIGSQSPQGATACSSALTWTNKLYYD